MLREESFSSEQGNAGFFTGFHRVVVPDAGLDLTDVGAAQQQHGQPGLTNAAQEENGQRVVGLNTENQEINEGLVRAPITTILKACTLSGFA